MKPAIVTALLALGLAPLAAQAQSAPNTQVGATSAPGKVAGAAATTITAKVTAVDPATRSVTLEGTGGKTRTIQVGDQVRNFDQIKDPSQLQNIKKGDHVQVTYVEALAISLAEAPAKR